MTQSIVRYLIATALAYLVGHGVITQDIANANTAALTNYAIIFLTLIGTVGWSYLEKKYKGVLGLYFPPSNSSPTLPKASVIILLAVSLGAVSALSGCGTFAAQTYTYTPAGARTPVVITGFGAWCENNLTVITTATKATAQAGADFLIKKGTTRTRIAGYMTATAGVLQPLATGQPVSQTEIDTAATSLKLDDADGAYSEIAAPVLTLIGGYFVTLENENVPGKVFADVLNAVINGFLAVAQEYATTT
jgi:hypothetical protein